MRRRGQQSLIQPLTDIESRDADDDSDNKNSNSYNGHRKKRSRCWLMLFVLLLSCTACCFCCYLVWDYMFLASPPSTDTTTAPPNKINMNQTSRMMLLRHQQQQRLSNDDPPTNTENHNNNDIYEEETGGASLVFGTYHRFVNNTSETVYAYAPYTDGSLSANTLRRSNNNHIKIAVLIHACTHSALKFFSPHPSRCPQCIGLSEEIRISKILLRNGWNVIAISSNNRKTGCWNDNELQRVQQTIIEFKQNIIQYRRLEQQQQQHQQSQQQSIPVNPNPKTSIIAVGASSGGHFVSLMAAAASTAGFRILPTFHLVGCIIMVSRIGPKIVERYINNYIDKLEKQQNQNQRPQHLLMPKLYLAPMPKDKVTTNLARQDYETIIKGISSAAGGGGTSSSSSTSTTTDNSIIKFDNYTCIPLNISVTYLNERVPYMTKQMSKQIINLLIKAKHIIPTVATVDGSVSTSDIDKYDDEGLDVDNHRNYTFIKDPTRSNWREILQESCGTGNGSIEEHDGGCLFKQVLTQGKSPLAKALNRAWGYHEYCSEVIELGLQFFSDGSY